MLKGQKKKDYQRIYMKEYMRKWRIGLNEKEVGLNEVLTKEPIRPKKVETQSYNPMMVGYVPKI